MPTVWAGRVRVTVQTSDCGFLGHRPYFELGVSRGQLVRGSGDWRKVLKLLCYFNCILWVSSRLCLRLSL